MPFNRPITKEDEAAAHAAVLAEHAMMRKRIAELDEELAAAHRKSQARIVDLEDALTFLRGALAAEESRYEKERNRHE